MIVYYLRKYPLELLHKIKVQKLYNVCGRNLYYVAIFLFFHSKVIFLAQFITHEQGL